MDIKNVITINKRFVIIMLSVIGIALLSSYSYALYQVNFIKSNVVVLQTASNLTITTTIDDTNSNSFTLPASGNKTVVVHLDTNGITSAMAYKMWYEVTSGYGTFTVTSTETFPNDKVEGIMQPIEKPNNEKITGKNITLTFTNNSANALTISLGAIGGFEKTGASLTTESELLLNTNITIEPPTYTSSQIFSNIHSNDTSNECQNATLTWTDPADGTIYISGSATCVDFNYVWYSGKMWRIVAKYSDGSMKLVTDNNITSIAFGTNVNFYTDANTTSYMYQWLNEDFYDTLYNSSNIIDTTIQWNATNPSPDSNDIAVKPGNDNLVTANVGLLNSYEYYNSYRCNGSAACSSSTSSSGYLNIGYNWWLLNPYSSSDVRNVYYDDGSTGDFSPADTGGVRPSINLKSEISLLGSGTKTDPYKIVGDKEQPIYNTTLINTRLSGEYVKIQYQENNENTLSPLYRIVGVDNNTTKIVMMEYLNNKATKPFATDNTGTIFGSGTTIDNDNKSTWYSYLNGSFNGNVSNEDGWFHSLGYKSLLTSGTYFMGNGSSYNYSSYNYKEAICANSDLNNTTKLCTKTSNIGTYNVGLLRYGELFATQQGTGYSNSIYMWLITKYSSSHVRFVYASGGVGYGGPSYAFGVRPSINLISEVKILSGTGTELDPYIVGV